MDEDFKNFMSLVNIYTQRLTLGNSVYNLVTNLEEEILIYEYNKIELSNELKALCGFIEKDEDIENNRYALAYAASKYFNTTETGNKQVDKYILQMQQKYGKII